MDASRCTERGAREAPKQTSPQRMSDPLSKWKERKRRGKTPFAILCFFFFFFFLLLWFARSVFALLLDGWMFFVFIPIVVIARDFSGVLLSMLASECIAAPILAGPSFSCLSKQIYLSRIHISTPPKECSAEMK